VQGPTGRDALPRSPRRSRVPAVMQLVAAECGAASLASVLAHHGSHRPLAQVRETVGVDRDGANALRLVKAAQWYGLEAEGVEVEVGALPQLELPAIIHWGADHFVVLEGWDRSGWRIMDPAVGHRRVPHSEFLEHFSGVAIALRPGARFSRNAPPAHVSELLRAWLAGSWPLVTVMAIGGALLTVPAVALPGLMATFVDAVLGGGDTSWLVPMTAIAAALLALEGGLVWVSGSAGVALQERISTHRTEALVRRAFRLPIGFFSQRFDGDVADRIAAVDGVADLIAGGIVPALVQMLTLLALLAATALISPVFAAVAVGGALMALASLGMVARAREDRAHVLQLQQGLQQGALTSGLQSMATLRAAGREADFVARMMGLSARVCVSRQQAGVLASLAGAVPEWVQVTVVFTLTLTYGGWCVIRGTMSLGELLAAQALLIAIMAPVGELADLLRQLQVARADLARIDDVAKHPEDPAAAAAEGVDGTGASVRPGDDGGSSLARIAGPLKLRGVSAGYGRSHAPLISGLECEVNPGERVALVGATGSGKSSVLRIAAGLIEPWSGSVTIGEVPVRSIGPSARAASVALVSQRVSIFTATLRENLALWDGTVDDSDMIEALADAQLGHLCQERGGLDRQLLAGGANLSGGEAQRVEIARALCRRPRILLMDEATSALDPVTERAVLQALACRGIACLMVAHRPSALRHCDRVLLLDGGRIAVKGTHQELAAQSDAYRSLVGSQP
jgi:ABC-type bacteriocin/lantibiotic exporter with double-glycine peptidase domain